MPIQKFGTEMPARPMTFAAQSHAVSRFTADTIPAGMPMPMPMTKPMAASWSVTGSFWAIRAATGWPMRQL